MSDTATPGLHQGPDTNSALTLWLSKLEPSARAYIVAVAEYNALAKHPQTVLAALPETATATDRYNALEAAGSAITAAHQRIVNAAQETKTQFSRLFEVAPTQGEQPHVCAMYFSHAAEKERVNGLEAEQRTREMATLVNRHQAADALEAARKALRKAEQEAQSAGLPT